MVVARDISKHKATCFFFAQYRDLYTAVCFEVLSHVLPEGAALMHGGRGFAMCVTYVAGGGAHGPLDCIA
jgi:hypothetical protein